MSDSKEAVAAALKSLGEIMGEILADFIVQRTVEGKDDATKETAAKDELIMNQKSTIDMYMEECATLRKLLGKAAAAKDDIAAKLAEKDRQIESLTANQNQHLKDIKELLAERDELRTSRGRCDDLHISLKGASKEIHMLEEKIGRLKSLLTVWRRSPFYANIDDWNEWRQQLAARVDAEGVD